jgi:hypothetical protein
VAGEEPLVEVRSSRAAIVRAAALEAVEDGADEAALHGVGLADDEVRSGIATGAGYLRDAGEQVGAGVADDVQRACDQHQVVGAGPGGAASQASPTSSV